MKFKMYVPLYSLTLLLSASLLFSVQPMFSKMALPLLGGAPNVWTTAMLFFQTVLALTATGNPAFVDEIFAGYWDAFGK